MNYTAKIIVGIIDGIYADRVGETLKTISVVKRIKTHYTAKEIDPDSGGGVMKMIDFYEVDVEGDKFDIKVDMMRFTLIHPDDVQIEYVYLKPSWLDGLKEVVAITRTKIANIINPKGDDENE